MKHFLDMPTMVPASFIIMIIYGMGNFFIFGGVLSLENFGVFLTGAIISERIKKEDSYLNNKPISPRYYFLLVLLVFLPVIILGPRCTYNQAKNHLREYLVSEYGYAEFINEGKEEFLNSGRIVKTRNPIVISFYAFLVNLKGEEVLVLVNPMNKRILVTDYLKE